MKMIRDAIAAWAAAVKTLLAPIRSSPRMTAAENRQEAAFPQSQRDCVTKPRVARNELPWVNRLCRLQPQWGCVTLLSLSRNPVGVVPIRAGLPRVARSSQPWALGRNPFGILQK